MPILKKKRTEPQLPATLQDQARSALYLQIASQFYKEKYDQQREAFFGLIANSQDVTLEAGKSVKFTDGLVRWQARSNYTVDKEAVAEAIRAGKLSADALLACVSKFDHNALGSLLPAAVTEAPATEFGVMQATAEFKKGVLDRLEEDERERAEILEAVYVRA